jgi:hypothetical protein
MNLIRREIESRPDARALTVWFDAWQYESEAHPAIALCAAILAGLRAQQNVIGAVFGSIARALRAVAYGFSLKAEAGLPLAGQLGAEFSAKDVLDRADDLAGDEILQQSLYYNAFDRLHEAASHLGDRRIVVFIDDLDRCLPENAVKLLESIKLVLHQPGFVYVFGLDERAISSFVAQRYAGVGSISGAVYLDKLFQMTFFIPDYSHLIADYAAATVLSHLGPAARRDFGPLFPAIGSFCRDNPRAVKRFLNNITIDRAIASKRAGIAHIPLIHFALARALQMHWPIVADAIRYDDDGICAQLSEGIYGREDGEIEAISALASDESNVNAPVYRLILHDRSLQSLIVSPAARQWLSSETRPICWSMLQGSIPRLQPGADREPGNAFVHAVRGQIADQGSIYTTVIRAGWCQEKVRQVFPERASEIAARADEAHWRRVSWDRSQAGIGRILGWVVHSNGSRMLLMEFKHRGESLYLLADEAGVEQMRADKG